MIALFSLCFIMTVVLLIKRGCLKVKKKTIGTIIGGTALVVGGSIGAFQIFKHVEPQKYSKKWFDILPVELLEQEREVVRKEMCSAGRDYAKADRLWHLLNVFDRVLREKKYGNTSEYVFPPKREHGWNLYKPD